MHINLTKENTSMPLVTTGCVIIAKGKTTGTIRYFMVVKRLVTYSGLNLETHRLAHLDMPTPEAVLESIAKHSEVLEILSPAQLLITRKDVN